MARMSLLSPGRRVEPCWNCVLMLVGCFGDCTCPVLLGLGLWWCVVAMVLVVFVVCDLYVLF